MPSHLIRVGTVLRLERVACPAPLKLIAIATATAIVTHTHTHLHLARHSSLPHGLHVILITLAEAASTRTNDYDLPSSM